MFSFFASIYHTILMWIHEDLDERLENQYRSDDPTSEESKDLIYFIKWLKQKLPKPD